MPYLVQPQNPVHALRQVLSDQAGIPAAGGDQEISLLVKAVANLQDQKASGSAPPSFSGLTTGGLLQATSPTTVASTLTPAGITSLSVTGPGSFGGILTAPTALGGTSTTQVATTEFVAGAVVGASAALINPRAPRQGYVFDGSAWVTGGSLSAYGTSDFSFFAYVYLPNISANYAFVGGATNSFVFFSDTNGSLITSLANVASNTNSPAGSVAPGWSLVGYTRAGTTGNYWVNGAAVATISDTLNYSVASSIIGAAGNTGTYQITGSIAQRYAYNRALSAAEVLALYQQGAPAGADYNNASNAALNTSTVTTAGSGGISGTSATGFVATASGVYYVRTAPVFSVIKGCKYRVSFTASALTGTWNTYISLLATTVDSSLSLVASGANTFEMVATATRATNEVIEFASSGAGTLTVSGLTVTPLGLLSAPDAMQPGRGLIGYDTSGNGANDILPAIGVTWRVPSSPIITATGDLTLSPGVSATNSVRVTNTTASTSTTTGSLINAGGFGNTGSGYFGGAVIAGGQGVFGQANASGTGVGSYGASPSGGLFGFISGSMTGTKMYGFTDQNATCTVNAAASEVMSYRAYATLALGTNALTNWFGFKSTLSSKTGAGVLTNAYGFYADSPTFATNNYAFFSAGSAPSQFGGPLNLTDTTPSSSTTTGSLINAGGFGNAGVAYFGGDVTRTGTGEVLFIATTSGATNGARVRLTNSGASGRSFDLISGGPTSGDASLQSKFGIYDNTAGANRVSLDSNGLLTVLSTTGGLLSQAGVVSNNATAGIGYATGAGGTVTQLTSRTTGVTLNKVCGQITLFAAIGSVAATSFTITNSTVAATDVIRVSVASGTNKYLTFVTAIAAGSFEITFYTTGGIASDSPVINFAVLKAVNA